MRLVLLTAVVELTLAGLTSAISQAIRPHRTRLNRHVHGVDSTGKSSGTFPQLIDHSNPSLGTFEQRFWWSDNYYGGPGSPIILLTPSEGPEADASGGRINNASTSGLYAQTNKAAVITLEHRYFGNSTPVGFHFTSETLQHLTLNNSILDLTYFAQNVKLPFDTHGKSKPDKAPWILMGCSYAGALTAWTQALAPGTFWAYHCGSAVVEAKSDLWDYYAPIQQAMPQNCSTDWKRIISHVDVVLGNGTAEEKRNLRTSLGYGVDANVSDAIFAEHISDWLSDWQFQQPGLPYASFFFQRCDSIEVSHCYPSSLTKMENSQDHILT